MKAKKEIKKLQLNKETIAKLDKLDEIRAGGIVASGMGGNIFITTLEPATFTFICIILKSLVECTRGNSDLPTIGYDELNQTIQFTEGEVKAFFISDKMSIIE